MLKLREDLPRSCKREDHARWSASCSPTRLWAYRAPSPGSMAKYVPRAKLQVAMEGAFWFIPRHSQLDPSSGLGWLGDASKGFSCSSPWIGIRLCRIGFDGSCPLGSVGGGDGTSQGHDVKKQLARISNEQTLACGCNQAKRGKTACYPLEMTTLK